MGKPEGGPFNEMKQNLQKVTVPEKPKEDPLETKIFSRTERSLLGKRPS